MSSYDFSPCRAADSMVLLLKQWGICENNHIWLIIAKWVFVEFYLSFKPHNAGWIPSFVQFLIKFPIVFHFGLHADAVTIYLSSHSLYNEEFIAQLWIFKTLVPVPV